MPFVIGTDYYGKTHYLQESGYWGDRVSACNFHPIKAREAKEEIKTRNVYSKAVDRIDPEIKDVLL